MSESAVKLLGQMAARMALAQAGLYLLTVGATTLLAPTWSAALLGQGEHRSCYPWIQLIGPMALPLGLAVLLSAFQPVRFRLALIAIVALAATQLLLDLSLFDEGTLSLSCLVVEFIVWGNAAAIVLFHPEYWPALRGVRLLRDGDLPKAQYVATAVLALYLLCGGIWATMLPRTMNALLAYPVHGECIAWVKLTGPAALAMGVTLCFAGDRADRRALLLIGVGGCTIELMLDAYFLLSRAFGIRQILIDVFVAAYCLWGLLPLRRTN